MTRKSLLHFAMSISSQLHISPGVFLLMFYLSSSPGVSAYTLNHPFSNPQSIKSYQQQQQPHFQWRNSVLGSSYPHPFHPHQLSNPSSVAPSIRSDFSYPGTTLRPFLKRKTLKNEPSKGSELSVHSEVEERQESTRPRIPGLPRNPPWPITLNLTNVAKLIQMAANDEDITDEAEELLVQTLSQVSSFIGLQDTRDLFGMFLMYFILGPILIPLYWMPISLLALGFLMIPLVYKAPPGGRDLVQSSSCMEMISCEISNTFRGSSWSSWADERFNLTLVEWSGRRRRRLGRQEECSKYPCVFLQPIRRFFGSWYTYVFEFKNLLNSDHQRQKLHPIL